MYHSPFTKEELDLLYVNEIDEHDFEQFWKAYPNQEIDTAIGGYQMEKMKLQDVQD